MIDLGTLGHQWSRGNGINNRGMVAGSSWDPTGNPLDSQAFVWDAKHGMVWLPGLTSLYGEAEDIDDSGDVVGCSGNLDATRATLWDRSRLPRDLGTLGGLNSWAYGMNDTGIVVGQSHTDLGMYHAFAWTERGGMVDLGTFGGRESCALEVNNAGKVVGFAQTSGWIRHAFIWDARKGLTDLGTLDGYIGSGAMAISNSGNVVGYCYNDEFVRDARACIWDAKGRITALEDLIDPGSGWQLGLARDITEKGLIVGVGTNPDHQDTGFLLIPRP